MTETKISRTSPAQEALLNACRGISHALGSQDVGAIAEKHGELILHYYQDVQRQAQQSFTVACSAARCGYYVLIGTMIVAIGLAVAGATRGIDWRVPASISFFGFVS